MKDFFKKYSLIAILLVAAILRLWKLGTIPPSITPDEAALGYNAYSILKTGKDEYGQVLPIVFQSFGDYKPGLYIYLTIPFVAIFGLNEWSVRLPSALAGIIAVWLIFLIVRLMINSYWSMAKKGGLTIKYQSLVIVAAFLLAVNPWHIHFSRGAWEANLALALTLVGIYFFLKSLKNSRFLILASLFFSTTLLTYQGAKLSTLIVLFVLVVTFRKEIKTLLLARSDFASSIIVGLIITSPILISFISGQAGRLNIFNVFSYPRPQEYLKTFLDQGKEHVGDLNYYLFHSETLNFARGVMGRWFNHFSGRFLFFEGDWQNPRHSAPNQGMLLLIDLIVVPLGLFSLVKEKSKLSSLILLWLVLAPFPAALSRDQVHAVRSLNMVIPLVLVSSFGLAEAISWIKNFKDKMFLRTTCYLLLTIIFLGSLIFYLDAYFVHLPKHDSQLWSYGYKQIVETVTPIQSRYQKVRVQQSFAQPYIYFLFYQRHDPAEYQKQAKLIESEYKGDVGYVEKLDNICFCAIDWQQNKKEHGTLVVADDIRIPKSEVQSASIKEIAEIKYLNGETAFRIVEVK